MNNRFRRSALGITRLIALMLSAMLSRWPLILVAVFFLMDEGPHIRLEGTYRGTMENPVYVNCTYLGSRGLRVIINHRCPFVLWLTPGEDRS